MAAPTIDFAGFVYDDAGDAVSGAVVHIYDKNSTSTAREASSITTNSSGYWSYSHATPGEFDVEVVSGASKRRFKFDDKVHLSGIDVETLSVRGNEGALAAIYMYADEGDDASDQWRIDAGTDGVLAIGNDAASQGTFVDHITFTPNSTVANSTVAFKGGVTIAGDLTITGDDLVMGTNTSGHVLVADGTNYNPVAVSGDITMAANGAVTIASTAVETGMIAADAITGAKIADDAIGSEHIADDAITSALIADDAITSALIADDAITTALIADDAITSALIADGAIVNADVNASAAIAISKTALVAGTNISLSTNTLNVDDAFLKNDADDTTSGILTVGGIVLSDGKGLVLDSTPADDAYTGIYGVYANATGSTITKGQVVYMTGTANQVAPARANAAGTMPAVAMAIADVANGASGNFLKWGYAHDASAFVSLTIGGLVYVSDTAAGALDATAPADDGEFVQVLGLGMHGDKIFFNPQLTMVEIA